MSPTEPQEYHARCLAKVLGGHPLIRAGPDPDFDTFAQEGTQPYDLAYISDSGDLSFLFSTIAEKDDPRNVDNRGNSGAPPFHKPKLENWTTLLDRGMCENTLYKSEHIVINQFGAQVTAPGLVKATLSFLWSHTHGAAIHMPNAHMIMASSRRIKGTMKHYARSRAVQWYKYYNQDAPTRADYHNGDLYFITGGHKCVDWTTFTIYGSTRDTGASLGVQGPAGAGAGISAQFTRAEGLMHFQHSYPLPGETARDYNQCPLVKGYRIRVRQSLFGGRIVSLPLKPIRAGSSVGALCSSRWVPYGIKFEELSISDDDFDDECDPVLPENSHCTRTGAPSCGPSSNSNPVPLKHSSLAFGASAHPLLPNTGSASSHAPARVETTRSRSAVDVPLSPPTRRQRRQPRTEPPSDPHSTVSHIVSSSSSKDSLYPTGSQSLRSTGLGASPQVVGRGTPPNQNPPAQRPARAPVTSRIARSQGKARATLLSGSPSTRPASANQAAKSRAVQATGSVTVRDVVDNVVEGAEEVSSMLEATGEAVEEEEAEDEVAEVVNPEEEDKDILEEESEESLEADVTEECGEEEEDEEEGGEEQEQEEQDDDDDDEAPEASAEDDAYHSCDSDDNDSSDEDDDSPNAGGGGGAISGGSGGASSGESSGAQDQAPDDGEQEEEGDRYQGRDTAPEEDSGLNNLLAAGLSLLAPPVCRYEDEPLMRLSMQQMSNDNVSSSMAQDVDHIEASEKCNFDNAVIVNLEASGSPACQAENSKDCSTVKQSYHALNGIMPVIEEAAPYSKASMAHDDDYLAVLEKGEYVPDAPELASRMIKKFVVEVDETGVGILIDREEAGLRAQNLAFVLNFSRMETAINVGFDVVLNKHIPPTCILLPAAFGFGATIFPGVSTDNGIQLSKDVLGSDLPGWRARLSLLLGIAADLQMRSKRPRSKKMKAKFLEPNETNGYMQFARRIYDEWRAAVLNATGEAPPPVIFPGEMKKPRDTKTQMPRKQDAPRSPGQTDEDVRKDWIKSYFLPAPH